MTQTKDPQIKSPTKAIMMETKKAPASEFLAAVQWLANPMKFLENEQKLYGDNFRTKIPGFAESIFLSHPQAVEAVFSADPSYFDASVSTQILQPLVGINSLIRLDGVPHERQRKLLMPSFHGARMQAYGHIIRDISNNVIREWIPGKTIAIRPYSQEISLQVMLNAIFGVNKQGERYEQLRRLLADLFDSFNSPVGSSMLYLKFLQRDLGPMSPWGRFQRRKQQIYNLLTAEIQERRTQPLGEDILSLMMSAHDEQGEPMTEAELQDELMTLMFGGNETAANTLAWALYVLHKFSDVRHKLLEELSTLPADAEPSTIMKLPYLDAVVSETLRMYPVVLFSFARKLKYPLEVMGCKLEPGTVVTPISYLTHLREDLFPEPRRFRPERFLERQFSFGEYYPFGGSNRRCIGAAFALFEIKMVLATILPQVQLSLAEKRPVQPMQRGITITPSGGIRMKVISSPSS